MVIDVMMIIYLKSLELPLYRAKDYKRPTAASFWNQALCDVTNTRMVELEKHLQISMGANLARLLLIPMLTNGVVHTLFKAEHTSAADSLHAAVVLASGLFCVPEASNRR